MVDKWLVTLDVDRTTLTDDYRVLPEVRNAVARVRRAGVFVTLATARAPDAVRHVLKDLGEVDAAICCGGALLMLRSEQGWQIRPGMDQPFVPTDLLPAVVRTARELDVPLAIYTTKGAFVDRMEPVLADEFRLTGMVAWEHDLLELDAPVAKLLAIGRPGETAALRELRQVFDAKLACVFSHGNMLEIMRQGVSKGEGLLGLSKGLGVGRTKIITIGDSENDLSMFAVADLAIAMGNASEDIRAAAHWVTTTNNEGGVAAALLRCHKILWEE